MRRIFKRGDRETRKQGFFSGKTYDLKKVQEEFAGEIRQGLMDINDRLDLELKKRDRSLDEKLEDYIYSELTSNLFELELNINTIIMNFSRITGVSMDFEDGEMEERSSLLKRGQIYFLLDGDASHVYGQELVYLEEEFRRELKKLGEELDDFIGLLDSSDALSQAKYIDREYFRINSDMNIIIDDINRAIENIYDNIAQNKNMDVNLIFLLISAFLSLILFFPEFNTMLNLRDEELSYQDSLDQIIYEKMIDEVDLESLLEIRESSKEEEILDHIDNDLLKDIIKSNLDFENEKLEREKNRIKIFVGLLFLILLVFLVWILFIVL